MENDPKAPLKKDKRLRPDFRPGRTGRTTEAPAPVMLDTNNSNVCDGRGRVDDAIALPITNRGGGFGRDIWTDEIV